MGRHGRHEHHSRQVVMVATVAPAVALLAICSHLIIQSVPQRRHFTITKISLLILFKEIIAVYNENHTKQKMQTYRLSSRWDRYLPLGFKVLMTLFLIPSFIIKRDTNIMYAELKWM
jgi:hypothetical protein